MDVQSGFMEHMTWPEVAAAARANLPVVMAVGATEQHGPHLPITTDCLLPVGVALETAKRLPLIVAPPIRFGARSRALSGGGETFPGTLSLRGTTLIAIVSELLKALARSGFHRLCVQCWHWENRGYLWEACDLAVQEHHDIKIALLEAPMPTFSANELADLFPKGFPGWDVEHASIVETSMMLALHPGLVRRDQIVDDEAKRRPSWDVIPAPPDFIPKSGVLWHPSEANETLGRRFLDATSRRLEDILRTEFEIPA